MTEDKEPDILDVNTDVKVWITSTVATLVDREITKDNPVRLELVTSMIKDPKIRNLVTSGLERLGLIEFKIDSLNQKMIWPTPKGVEWGQKVIEELKRPA